MAQHLARLLNRMKGRRVAVLGDWMLDRYLWGAASRLSPEAAVPVVDFAASSDCLGGAGNVAANLAALGARVTAYGATGEDEAGRALRSCLRAVRISGAGILHDSSRPTTVKTRIIARHQQVVRVDRESRDSLAQPVAQRLLRRVLPALGGLDALIISDYDKGVVTDEVAERVLAACRRAAVPAFVKPKWLRAPGYRGAAAVVVNRAEASFLTQVALDSDKAVELAAEKLLEQFDCRGAVITRGEQGMSVCERGGRFLHIPATSRERHFGQAGRDQNSQGRQVFDVTGAGDTVLSTLALASAAGANLRDAALLGNAAAGVVVGKLGTAAVTPAELRAALNQMSLGRAIE